MSTVLRKSKIVLRLASVMLGGLMGLTGCQEPAKPTVVNRAAEVNERHAAMFGNYDLPRKIGSVENIGLQLPTISPDGERMLYLRSDQENISPMTLLGDEIPKTGSLTIWIRPVQGASSGKQLSTQRWASSPVWSRTGKAVAYVVHEPPMSYIVHQNLIDGTTTSLGVDGQVNCLPQFGIDERTLLFCAAQSSAGPFRIYKQSVDDDKPTAMSPEGVNCLLPVMQQNPGSVICAEAESDQLKWVVATEKGLTDLNAPGGTSALPESLQTWAGVSTPVSPDGKAFLFYNDFQNRICVYHLGDRLIRNHRLESIAACWLNEQAIALATGDRVFLVSTQTGMSLELFNGAWIPSRYIPLQRKLFLFERENSRRFSIVEVQFKDRVKSNKGADR